LTSDLVFSSFPRFGFFILFFAFQLCFELVLENSTLGGGCLLLAEHVMFPSGSVQPLKVTLELIFS